MRTRQLASGWRRTTSALTPLISTRDPSDPVPSRRQRLTTRATPSVSTTPWICPAIVGFTGSKPCSATRIASGPLSTTPGSATKAAPGSYRPTSASRTPPFKWCENCSITCSGVVARVSVEVIVSSPLVVQFHQRSEPASKDPVSVSPKQLHHLPFELVHDLRGDRGELARPWGQVDERRSAIVRIGLPLDQARLLHQTDHRRHRLFAEPRSRCERAHAQAVLLEQRQQQRAGGRADRTDPPPLELRLEESVPALRGLRELEADVGASWPWRACLRAVQGEH